MKGNGSILVLLLVAGKLPTMLGLPVVTQPPKPAEKEEKHEDSNVERMEVYVWAEKEESLAKSGSSCWNNIIEYNKYLQEVVNVLESDPVFAEKLQKAAESDIRSGVIAQELEYVGHHVRSRLDELKRMELQRLKELATKQFELTNEIDRDHLKISEHVDHSNPHTFEIDDLKKLILKTSQDLQENDRRRREEFKQYELQKEFEKQEKLRALDEQHRKEYEEELKRQQAKHDNHEKIHHPGNKAQLEEVWEKQDHMDGQDFDPKTFFMLHDLDGNNMWDENEVKVLFINELNKMYQAGAPEDDMKERAEEMERMREHVFKEADTNKDGLISYEEFIEQTKRDEFQKDPGWDTVDHEPQFTHEEYLEFERRRQEEIQRLVAEGKLPPHPNMPQGYHPDANLVGRGRPLRTVGGRMADGGLSPEGFAPPVAAVGCFSPVVVGAAGMEEDTGGLFFGSGGSIDAYALSTPGPIPAPVPLSFVSKPLPLLLVPLTSSTLLVRVALANCGGCALFAML
uniref:EF-hand domain-containing protein n=1 Tax=Anopheles melas TaxID=34690 RepID=A0A182TLU6_9DIPT